MMHSLFMALMLLTLDGNASIFAASLGCDVSELSERVTNSLPLSVSLSHNQTRARSLSLSIGAVLVK